MGMPTGDTTTTRPRPRTRSLDWFLPPGTRRKSAGRRKTIIPTRRITSCSTTVPWRQTRQDGERKQSKRRDINDDNNKNYSKPHRCTHSSSLIVSTRSNPARSIIVPRKSRSEIPVVWDPSQPQSSRIVTSRVHWTWPVYGLEASPIAVKGKLEIPSKHNRTRGRGESDSWSDALPYENHTDQ